ncbi:ribosome small subunit-dependent GTPase A [Schleiferiaceae bacterium]|jgi:ribosome biogenesis GTPase|nr:ribosome small subunit-dependent GTPase A [Schleiferiaceae bacterium]
MTGRVIKSTGSWYRVQLHDGPSVDARLRGSMRLQGSRATNPVAVGDFVELEPESEGRYAISNVLERKNHLIRRSVNLSKKTQVIAANIDQAILICTIAEPKTLLGFMDRFLASAEAYGIPALLVFNKMDVYGPSEMEELSYREAAYQRAGYPCMRISAVSGEGMDALRAVLKDKVTLFSGHSGVGKSTLANALQSGLDLRTGEISSAHGQGQHTTTFAEMHPLDFGGYLIDTPGIRGFGLVNMEKDQVSHYFPEIFALSEGCKYHNCTHVDEPHCAVIHAYEQHQIAPSRYENYVHMLNGDEGDDPYRHSESKGE